MTDHLDDEDYRALADIRFELRRFMRFSEVAAKEAGIRPQHHQALLAIRGAGGHMLVGSLAEKLMLRPHTTTELVDRMVHHGLVARAPGLGEQRQVDVMISDKGVALLTSLSTEHRSELRRIRPLLSQLIAKL